MSTNYYDPNRGFRFWARSELRALGGSGLWVPNKGDMVVDDVQGFMKVTSVDISTGYSTLVPFVLPDIPDLNAGEDILLGAGPGYPSESYRIFLDTSVTPHTFAPDTRLRFYGTGVQHYKVFLGSDISEQYGVVISLFYDNSGTLLGNSIPVESIVIPGITNTTIKAPMVGYCDRSLNDGELVTLVAYSDNGGVVSIAQLLVKNSAAIRQQDASKKYIQGISIDSPFINNSDPQLIEFPINVTVESLPMTGVVHYSNGDQYRLPIDGNKFTLFGIQNYVATVVGQTIDMVLSYRLAPDEVSYGVPPTANGTINVPYSGRTTPVNGAYSVKLFIYPVWVNALLGYRLEYWMYNLDRQAFYNVTPYIELGAVSAPFNPTAYGISQTITVALDLDNVNGIFGPYRHVQTFQIALLTRGDEAYANWQIAFRPDQDSEYGRDLYADLEIVDPNYWRLRLNNDSVDQATWLEKMYYRAEPLYDPLVEVGPLEPTHFRVVFIHNTYEYPISQWNEVLIVNNDLDDGELVYIQWIRRTLLTDLQLAITAIPARRRV